jgi:hypothetical protein
MGRSQAVAYDYYADDQQAAYWQEAAYQEAARVTELERRRLEAEMQGRLDQVAAELELIESMNRRQVSGLRWRAFFLFVLAAAIATAAGWFFVKKVRPRVNLLQSMLVTQQAETDRLGTQLREQTEKTRSAEERYLAARAELDRTKKPEPPKAAPIVESPKPAAAAPQTKAPPPPRETVAPKAAKPPPPAAPPPPKKACNCPPGDPMCGCL